jgi:hypothetical protein
VSDNPRTLVQVNVRIPQGVRDDYDRFGLVDGVHAMDVIRHAILFYVSMRMGLTERVWHLLYGAAKADGLEQSELLARLVHRAYEEWGDELFVLKPKKAAHAKS